METGKTYWEIEPVGGREKQREWIRGEREREREVARVGRGNGVSCFDH